MAAIERMHSGSEVWRWKGLKMLGVYATPRRPSRRRVPGVLMLHGFPGSEKSVDVQRALLERGIASFAPYFAGAWGSAGLYRFTTLADQARAALGWLARRPEIDSRRLAVYGFSMGGWTALNLAGSRGAALRAAVAVAPVGGPEYISERTPEVIAKLSKPLNFGSPRALYRDFVRAIRGRVPYDAAARFRKPLLLVHGTGDEIVPFEVSRKVRAAAAGPCRLLAARGGDHSFLERRAWLVRAVTRFLGSALRWYLVLSQRETSAARVRYTIPDAPVG